MLYVSTGVGMLVVVVHGVADEGFVSTMLGIRAGAPHNPILSGGYYLLDTECRALGLHLRRPRVERFGKTSYSIFYVWSKVRKKGQVFL
jgi:hypothetical protein